MDNSSTLLEPKPHIVNRTSHPIRAMSNLRPLNSHQISTWEKRLLPFITFILVFARELGLFNKVESDRLSGKYMGLVAKKRVSDGGVNYASNREKYRSSRLVFEDP
ncbi:hypothetical protein Gotri_026166 [Gossypium trilobum]|uniref:Uncharacterized protein n=1 Tax=Gossypium trilobum TaxID=34281 RepID=A0A7J9FPF3_9ROSI|nr:hypothetical protein [Gossypium trilobum]